MKKYIKHLFCLALLSITSLAAMGQISILNVPSDYNRTSIVRMIDPTHYVVAKNTSPSSFNYVDLTTMEEHRTPLPPDVFVNDFEILDGHVFFCGQNNNTNGGVSGWFKISSLIAGTSMMNIIEHSANIPQIKSLVKMDVYKDSYSKFHIVSFGSIDIPGSIVSTIDVSIDISTNTYTVYHGELPNGTETIEDIVATNNAVFTIGVNELAGEIHTRRFTRVTSIGTSIFSAPPYTYNNYYKASVYTPLYNNGTYATCVHDDIVATICPYKPSSGNYWFVINIYDCNTIISPICKFMVDMETTSDRVFSIRDFSYNQIIQAFVVLITSYSDSYIYVIPFSGGIPSVATKYQFSNFILSSIDTDPLFPYMAACGVEYLGYSSYVRFHPVPSGSGCCLLSTIGVVPLSAIDLSQLLPLSGSFISVLPYSFPIGKRKMNIDILCH